MAGTRDIIGDTVRLLANHPIIGPTPNQMVPSVPINAGLGTTLVGGGNGPLHMPITLTTTIIAATLTSIVAIGGSGPIVPLWPRTGGVGAPDSTGFLPVPGFSNGTPAGGFSVFTPYLRGKLVLPVRIASSVAASVPAAGFSNSIIAFQLFCNTAPSAIPLVISTISWVNIMTAVAKTVDILLNFPIDQPFVVGTTSVNMFLQATNTDTAMTLTISTTPGDNAVLLIDD